VREKKRYKDKVFCPLCGEYGFLTRRWVESSYYPMYVSYYILSGIGSSNVRGSRYRGGPKSVYSPVEVEKIDKKSLYRVTYRRYDHYYVGHYSSEKYHQQMQDYKMHKRKSRPNGRKWCHLQSDCYLYKNDPLRRDFYLDSLPKDCYIAYCSTIKHRSRLTFS
jgi:hypothetical protein